MRQLELTKEKRDAIYSGVERTTSHPDLYFPDHVRPTARNCFVYGNYFKNMGTRIDPIICELGGLLHDIGYSEQYESNETDHIAKGIEFAPMHLNAIGIAGKPAGRIIDCIRTHDGNLTGSIYDPIPPENYVVNDVDSMQLFDWPIPSLIQFSKRLSPKKSLTEIIDGIKEHAHQTFGYIEYSFFRDLAGPKYESFLEQLEKSKNDKIEGF